MVWVFFFLSACFGLALGCIPEDVRTSGSGGSGGTGARAPTTKSLSVATWNVHNLIDDKLNSGTEFEQTDPNYVAHRKAVARVIDALNPLVFVLQEVESEAVLHALNGELKQPYEHTELIDGNDPRAVDVALLSRIAPTQIVSHRQDKFVKLGTSAPSYRYARDCLEVHLVRNDRNVVLLGVHFKSKDNDDPDKRLAEAQHTRLIADTLSAQDPKRAILVLGDMNDYAGSPAIDAIAGVDPLFQDAALQAASADRWSYSYNGQKELIDHQFANPLLASMLDLGSVTILHGKEVSAASDHAPVFTNFEIF